jgi:isoleucyl-tRNA synthetase
VHLTAKANFRALGPRYGPRTREAADAIAGLSAAQVRILQDGGREQIADDEIGLEDIVIVRTPREGVVVTAAGSLSVAIDTTLTDALRREGLARELVSRVQQLRRDAGLEVVDRIVLRWSSDDPEIAAAFEAHGAEIAAEVLANRLERTGHATGKVDVNGYAVALEVERA